MSAELREELRRRKPEILEFLRSAQAHATQPRAIVPLQTEGRRAPLFAVPGHNGDVFCYRALVQALGKDQPVYGLQPPGLDGRSPPLQSVAALAAYFAQQIRAFKPQGAVIVGGFCAGGAVAFELAQQLLAGGAVVDSVALFGSPYPEFFGFAAQGWRRTARRLAGVKKHLAALACGDWEYMVARWRARGVRPEAPKDKVLALRAAVEGATLHAVRNYRPVPFPGRLRLFLPCPSWARANMALRWRGTAGSAEEYYGLEGYTGDNMLLAPQAALFAALFQHAAAAPVQSRESEPPPPQVRRAA
jgi:thioesterase domain-containing protein